VGSNARTAPKSEGRPEPEGHGFSRANNQPRRSRYRSAEGKLLDPALDQVPKFPIPKILVKPPNPWKTCQTVPPKPLRSFILMDTSFVQLDILNLREQIKNARPSRRAFAFNRATGISKGISRRN
jgi:hypothetical protein